MSRQLLPWLLAAWLAGAAVFSWGRQVPDWAVAVFPSGAEFSLEIAATERKRMLGYMFREKVGPGEGMLFVFEDFGPHGIWMKNCLVPLDIVWLDEAFRVVEIVERAQPCPADGPCPSMRPLRNSRYVLEIAAGRAAEERLAAGDVVIVHAEPPL